MREELDMSIDKTESSRIDQVDFDNLLFGEELSDHMFMVEYKNGTWGQPSISAMQDLSFNPSVSSLHYGQTVFEGLKAFRNTEDEILIFRPEEHAKRMNLSAERLCMPEIPEELFLEGVYDLLKLDKQWIPVGSGRSLYIRPMMFATEQALGVNPSDSYLFIIFTSPAATYYSGTVKVIAETEYVRAAEGGTGAAKCGGNYAASLLPMKNALAKGYDQVIWTDAKTHNNIEEIGTMNVMFQIGDTIVTPSLTSSILSGITRKSIIALAKRWGQAVEERKISLDDLIEADKKGLLNDAFGTGTAATITHITTIGVKGQDLLIDEDAPRSFSRKAEEYLSKLKVGEVEDYMNWMVKI